MRQTHFYSLPRAVQHRFVESTRGVGVPAPLLVKLHKSRRHLWWAFAAALIAAGWLVFASVGYGDLDSPLALSPTPLVLAHVLFAAGLTYCVLRAQSEGFAAKRTPYVTGTFLFPSGVVVAGLSKLNVAPIEGLTDVRVSGSSVEVVVGGNTFSFVVADSAQANAIPAAIQEAKTKYLEARASGDLRQQLLLDPLQDSGVPNPLAPTEPWARPVFMSLWLSLVLVAVVSVVLGWAVFWVRNTWSGKALYAKAVQLDSSDAYEKYLARGGKRPEVEAILLPRAELKDAEAKHSVEAIEQYIKAHPQTRIAPEITAAHRKALLVALEKAKKTGSLGALNDLQNKHDGYPLIQGELEAAKQAIYDRALQNFKAQAASTPELLPLVQRLIQYSRAHGPKVELRFRVKYSQNYEHIEDIVKKSPYYTGPGSLPGQFFKGKYPLQREAHMGKRLVARLQKAFPEDVLDFEVGARVSDSDGDLPEVEVPTLFIEHSVTFSGGFVGLKRQGMFMGMTLAYRAVFRIPGQKGDQLEYRIRLWRAPKQELIDGAKDAEEIYETLATDAYDTFVQEYLEYWFKKP